MSFDIDLEDIMKAGVAIFGVALILWVPRIIDSIHVFVRNTDGNFQHNPVDNELDITRDCSTTKDICRRCSSFRGPFYVRYCQRIC